MHSVLLFLFVFVLGKSLAVGRPTELLTRATSEFKPKKQLSLEYWTTSLAPTIFTHFLSKSELQFLSACLPELLAIGLQCCCWPHLLKHLAFHVVLLILLLHPNLYFTWLYNPGPDIPVFHSDSTFFGTSQGSSVEIQVANCHSSSYCASGFYSWAYCVAIGLLFYCQQDW